ncbi:MAG TPA: hypothetical protein VD994_16590, partial [Prosthecobacter sp.]|nr:hypothetical protein [Prosthecobacter sp.]
MKKWLFVLGLLNVAPHCAADLREDFNNLFQKGKYDQAERLLMEEGPSSDDPAAAADILKSLREFRSIDRQNECAIIIHNPTGSTLTYQTRWGDGEWADSEIEPFSSWRHRHPANRDGEPLRGRPHLRLTNLPEEAKQIVYDLHASVVAKDEWEGVNKY